MFWLCSEDVVGIGSSSSGLGIANGIANGIVNGIAPYLSGRSRAIRIQSNLYAWNILNTDYPNMPNVDKYRCKVFV